MFFLGMFQNGKAIRPANAAIRGTGESAITMVIAIDDLSNQGKHKKVTPMKPEPIKTGSVSANFCDPDSNQTPLRNLANDQWPSQQYAKPLLDIAPA